MPISEAARTDLYNGLRDVIGPDRTETLVSVIAWHEIDEVATKRDLAELRAELRGDITSLETRLTRTITNWMVTILLAMIGAMVSIAFIV